MIRQVDAYQTGIWIVWMLKVPEQNFQIKKLFHTAGKLDWKKLSFLFIIPMQIKKKDLWQYVIVHRVCSHKGKCQKQLSFYKACRQINCTRAVCFSTKQIHSAKRLMTTETMTTWWYWKLAGFYKLYILLWKNI